MKGSGHPRDADLRRSGRGLKRNEPKHHQQKRNPMPRFSSARIYQVVFPAPWCCGHLVLSRAAALPIAGAESSWRWRHCSSLCRNLISLEDPDCAGMQAVNYGFAVGLRRTSPPRPRLSNLSRRSGSLSNLGLLPFRHTPDSSPTTSTSLWQATNLLSVGEITLPLAISPFYVPARSRTLWIATPASASTYRQLFPTTFCFVSSSRHS